MAKFTLSNKAEEDLLSIGRYTQGKWGITQRNRYLRELDKTFPLLSEHPTKGRKCDNIRQGYLKYRVGRHLIYFCKMPTEIEIVRILHHRMDADRHL